MDNLDFTEDEIQDQLLLLGYENIPKHRLSEFKKGSFGLYLHLTALLSFPQFVSEMMITFAVVAMPCFPFLKVSLDLICLLCL